MFRKNHEYPLSFTDCEMETIKNNLQSHHCLLTKSKAARLWGSCGDGVVGEGEDCDSGFLDKDKNLFSENECCDHKTCKYRKKDYKCWYGKCCKNCTIVDAKVCRKSVSECDLDEFCDGINPEVRRFALNSVS
ncbi:LOW QUALITY PROTEIN: hypothetical protein HZS_4860 [Henneguya salminicola]|nr:LOW QUALITY PROTEIN: hypothetical protein HZS_4860 [Henneguya salminicola]